MISDIKNEPENISTEEKILSAAQSIFTEKGFAATRTREIADAAGINLALLNYYFRSKEKLFQKVMLMNLHKVFSKVIPIISNKESALYDKIDRISEIYFDLLIKNPGLPLFILGEIQKNSLDFGEDFSIVELLKDSVILQQIHEKKPELDPLHFLFNFLGMTIFPFVTKPIFTSFDLMNEEMFAKFTEERRKLVPQWIKILLEN